MEILDADVNWHEKTTEDPLLVLTVDEKPDRSTLRFEGNTDDGLWYAETDDGYVEFYCWYGGEGRGYGGDHYDIITVDEEHVTLKGPYSSRDSCLNQAGYGPCIEAMYRDEDGYLQGIHAATVEVAEEAVEQYLDDVDLVYEEKFSNNEPAWRARRQD